MTLYINCVTAEKIMSCKKDPEINQYMELVNPQYMEGIILFDVKINLPDNFTVTSRQEGIDDYISITLSKLGTIELNTRDYRDLLIM